MQNRNEPPKGNNQNRNTSYYRARVGKGNKPKKETSVFMDRAKKRQMGNYRLAMIILLLLMIAFTGLILLGAWLHSLVGSGTEPEISGDMNSALFTTQPTEPNMRMNIDSGSDIESPLADISMIFYNYNGVYLDVQQLESLENLQYFINNIKSRGINAVNIDIKKEDGTVPYHINGQTDAVVGIEGYIDIPVKDIIDLFGKIGFSCDIIRDYAKIERVVVGYKK